MKQKLLNSFRLKATLLVAVLCALFTGTAWGDTSTVTASKITSSSVSWTGTASETWSVSVNGGSTNQNVNNGYAQVGTSSSPSTSITLSTAGISGTISSVVINCAAYQGKATVSCTVGGNNFGTQSQNVPSWSNSNGGNVTFTGSASGTIVITMTNGNNGRAMYVKSITVTYSTAPTTYSVTYDDNGASSGSVPTDATAYSSGATVTVLDNTGSLAKTGYAFSGWNTQNDGQGTNYTAGNTFAISANTTLYAKWTPYTVTAQSNNNTLGTVSASGFVITASPAAGSTYADPAYTVSSGTVTAVAQNGNEFTVTPSSDCTVTINFAAIPTHTLSSAVSPVGAGSVTLGSASVWEGGTTTATAAANSGYKFTGWSISGTGASLSSTSTNPTTVTMGTANATITANFEAVVTHKVNWSVNDIITTDNVEEGAAITFPDDPDDVNGKTFVGWYAAEYTHATDAPAFVNSANMGNADVTYYAVFATVDAEDPTVVTLSNSTITSNATGKGSYSNDYNIENWTGRYMISSNSSVYSLQLGYNTDSSKSAYNSHLTTPNCTDNIQSITIETQNSTASGRKFFLCSESDLGTADNGDATYGSGSLSEANGSVTINVTGNTKQLHIYPDGTAYIKTISLTSQSVSISDYTTDARAEAGISFANASVDVQLTSEYTGQVLNNPNSLTVSYSSSDPTVATVNSSTGEITELLKAGSTNITASFAGNATYKPAEVSYTLNVTEKTPCGLAYTETAVEKLTTDATFTNTLTNGYSLSVSYSSSATGVATVNASTGEVTIKGAGSTTITATFAGNEDYAAGDASYMLTVSKATPTLSFAADNATLRQGESYEGNALTNPASLTVSYSSSNTSVATVNASSGEPSFVAAGSTTITASFAGDDTYTEGSASYTLKVLATPTIPAMLDDDIAWGETFTVDDSGITGGTVTVTSGNTSIATVEGLEITSVACGEVEITVSTAEDETYKAGSTTFTLTVTAPAGASEKPSADPITVFYESFDKCNGTGGNDDTWSDTAGSGTASYDQSWSTSGSLGGAKQCLKMASGSNPGSITTPDIPTTAGTTYTVTFKAGSWKDKSSTLSLSATGASTTLSKSSFNLTNEEFINYEATFTAQGSKVTLTFSAASKKQIFLDEVRITEPTTPITSTTVTTTGGYATYCYQYPLDLDGISGAKAYKAVATDAETKKVRMTQITGTIMGGVPFILKADGDDDTFEIPLADESTTVPTGNLLVGTLAPTFVTQTNGVYTNFAYSKSNECFIMINKNGNTVPANRAYLPINLGGSSVKALTFDFDNATGINTVQGSGFKVQDSKIYNLAGQRVDGSRLKVNGSGLKTGIYIVNGKKVLVK